MRIIGRPNKPLSIKSKNHTKAEILAIQEAEEQLKGKDDYIYEVPDDITDDEKVVYQFLVDELKESKILSNLDTFLLRNLSFSVAGMIRTQEMINASDKLVQKSNGDWVKNPLYGVLADYQKQFNWGCKELGLSPSSRSAIANINLQAQQQEQDPLLRVLRGEDI